MPGMPCLLPPNSDHVPAKAVCPVALAKHCAVRGRDCQRRGGHLTDPKVGGQHGSGVRDIGSRPAGGSSSSVLGDQARSRHHDQHHRTGEYSTPSLPGEPGSDDQDEQNDQAREERQRSSSSPSALGATVCDWRRRPGGEPAAETPRRRAWHCQPGGQHRAAETNHDHHERSSIRSSCRLPAPSAVPPSGRK